MNNYKLNIAILGTRGIPNNYGGFEQFAEKFAIRMSKKGHQVTVYNSHKHAYQHPTYEGIQLIHCYDPEPIIGTTGQFVYDLNCILDSRKRKFDIILQLGYTSSTLWWRLLPKKSIIVTNMDGLEWKRAKYNKATQFFLKYAERWGAFHSDLLIADSIGIKEYIDKKYMCDSIYIPYGAEVFYQKDMSDSFKKLQLMPFEYDLLIARFEPENNIDAIIQAYVKDGNRLLVLVGNYKATIFGKHCYQQFQHNQNILFLNAIYDEYLLNELRFYSRLYLHGHSVGGTNPSLLEAMACSTLIVAHNNIFNKSVLNEHAFYFDNEKKLLPIIQQAIKKENYTSWMETNKDKIKYTYSWDVVAEKFESVFLEWMK